ncbi:polyphosphate kinase 2 family protein [bacterium]|nr:polyphosphate kinase 2 family protein [bacterium]
MSKKSDAIQDLYPKWLRVKADRFQLSRLDPAETRGPDGRRLDRQAAETAFRENIACLQKLQYRLYAECKHGVLVVLQAMDAGGKDGVIRHVLGPLNPQGVLVFSYKKPTPRELAHDFLWRIHMHTPGHGMIVCFNRSHYEDVLVVRVHELAPKSVWKARYAHINNFERLLVDSGTVILKFLLIISKDEQKRRMQARLERPHKNWKFSEADLVERKCFDAYQEAYQAMLEKTSLPHAPWYVIPADNKWFRNYAVSMIMRETLERLDPRFPAPVEGLERIVVE